MTRWTFSEVSALTVPDVSVPPEEPPSDPPVPPPQPAKDDTARMEMSSAHNAFFMVNAYCRLYVVETEFPDGL